MLGYVYHHRTPGVLGMVFWFWFMQHLKHHQQEGGVKEVPV
jgi:hypothetical protein